MESLMFIFCLTAPIALLIFSNYMNGREMDAFKKDVARELTLLSNRIDVLNGTCVKNYGCKNSKPSKKK